MVCIFLWSRIAWWRGIICFVHLTVRHSGCIGGICHGLQLVEHGLQFSTISRDHLLLFTGGLDDDRHFIAVAGDQRLAALELGDTADLSPGEFQDILDILSLVRLQVQDNLCLRVIENGSSVSPSSRVWIFPKWLATPLLWPAMPTLPSQQDVDLKCPAPLARLSRLSSS